MSYRTKHTTLVDYTHANKSLIGMVLDGTDLQRAYPAAPAGRHSDRSPFAAPAEACVQYRLHLVFGGEVAAFRSLRCLGQVGASLRIGQDRERLLQLVSLGDRHDHDVRSAVPGDGEVIVLCTVDGALAFQHEVGSRCSATTKKG